MNRLIRVLACSLLLLPAACATAPSAMHPHDDALEKYGAAIRWNEYDDAVTYLDPAVLEQQPLTDLDQERFKQIQVTGYDVKTSRRTPDGSIDRTVEIRLINKHTQIERTVSEHEHWRWDPVSKQYWLSSGLPDFAAQ